MLYKTDIENLKQRIYIGQKVEVQSSDVLWTDKKKKLIGIVTEKYDAFITCRFASGILEDFTYSQILTGDGVKLLGKGEMK